MCVFTQSSINNDWVIDFNGMLIRPGLFHAMGLENCMHCTIIFTFLVYEHVVIYQESFAHGYIISSFPITYE